MSQPRHANELARITILERMEASRTALVAANRTAVLPTARAASRSPVSTVFASLAEAPHVALLLALVVGGIVLGPRRTLSIAGRSGVTAWIARNVRRAIAQ
ncbi:hypothetical protein QF000_006874 [Paraburkholderia atlantica]|uniref:Uncharacterized protein n=1 Tax=Paraburkholderia atlantica TaxID=2654982 RepID=A0A6I1PWZ0_PARAM|nr:hypothetical protein [Paraburkholderia atlantica]MBB5415911.1 hypothetical protein [Paraburkholderia atlantica]MBB5424398.1 hypothetical protein [Paraburkholderia atlantica]MPW06488.1 hypothetical protein [Paraburkholderia atlantica]NUY31149.1 hypothetical protein [Paraburkholderia atlantica]